MRLPPHRPHAAARAPRSGCGQGMRPALLAAYRDLDSLRYDFPLVLSRPAARRAPRSLSAVMDDGAARSGAAGRDGRGAAHGRGCGSSARSAGWRRRATPVRWPGCGIGRCQAAAPSGDGAFLHDAGRIRDAIEVDGEIADCNAALPARVPAPRLVGRAAGQGAGRSRAHRAAGHPPRQHPARRLRALGGGAQRQPALQASFGAAHQRMFDFESMSKLLARGGPRGGLGERRRRRIEEALAVLKAQRFFAPAAGTADVHRLRVRDRATPRWRHSANGCRSSRGC